jgi:hypothetical protein
MTMKLRTGHLAITAAIIALVGCNNPDKVASRAEKIDPAKNATAAADNKMAASPQHRFADWAGKWTGPEGLFVEITPTTREHYDLKIQADLDTLGTYKGYDSEHGIKFEKDGRTESLRKVSGDETSLKYLAGKKDCLMIKQGEGFCRD